MKNKVTIDGCDFQSKSIIKKINVWKDYNNRDVGIVYKVRHGRRVELISVSKAGYVEIRKRFKKKTGYVNILFIRELKYGK